MVLSDKDSTRYSIPDVAVPRPKVDESMRLDMLGFEFFDDPFAFRFNDPVNPDKYFISTVN